MRSHPPARGRTRTVAALLLTGLLLPGLGSRATDPQASFQLDTMTLPRPARVRFGDVPLGSTWSSAFVLPGDSVRVEIGGGGVPGPYDLLAAGGKVRALGPRAWTWTAPAQPGIVRLSTVDSLGIDTLRIQAFVMTPYGALVDGVLNGYRIGRYPSSRVLGQVRYDRPRGFIEVTPENLSTPVSLHFTLGQFVCEQQGGYPKYVVLTERLIAKLEAIVAGLNRMGHPCATLGIMSAYRTPYYNHATGNVAYSRHQYGDAADFFVDADPVDGRMDDLNGDGRVDTADAKTLQCIIETLAVDSRDDIRPGGLGTYSTSKWHGPFVHTDARGQRIRWGASSTCVAGW